MCYHILFHMWYLGLVKEIYDMDPVSNRLNLFILLWLSFLLCTMELSLSQKVVIKIKWDNKIRCLTQNIEQRNCTNTNTKHKSYIFVPRWQKKWLELRLGDKVCPFQIKIAVFNLMICMTQFGNIMKVATWQRRERGRERERG